MTTSVNTKDKVPRAVARRLPVGAEVVGGEGVSFRVWAPESKDVAVELFSGGGLAEVVPLAKQENGYFAGVVRDARVGSRYKLRVDAGSFPDPVSRFQPEGPHGPSEVVDATRFKWTDQAWRGPEERGQVIYELHLGTFTKEGTWRTAMERLEALRELGVTMLEVMPVAEFAGTFGWGYDGVSLFAPTRLYGAPDEARAFVNRAHELGLAVILDVVYNHFGPDGCYLKPFARDYFSQKKTEWGEALNFDGPNSGPVREFFTSNARYWVEEFHFDGLRLDATQQIFDSSREHIVADVARAVREAAGERRVYVVAENEPEESRIVRAREAGGFGLHGIWNDDFHHTAIVAATGRREAYYVDHRGTAQEFVSALKHGFLYQGQWYAWQRKPRGSPAWDIPAQRFVIFLQNHDQVANSLRGQRLHELTDAATWRALTAVLLLAPQTPLFFQGQEFAASAPFLYFADHHPELRKLVSAGRQKSLEQFPSIAAAECRGFLTEPGERGTFERCKLDWDERDREPHAAAWRLHVDLLRVRREERSVAEPVKTDGAVLDTDVFVFRFFGREDDDRLLVVNLGQELLLRAVPEPLLAPPEGRMWAVQWSSESPAYGGNGAPDLETSEGWRTPARAALLLRPGEVRERPKARLHEGD